MWTNKFISVVLTLMALTFIACGGQDNESNKTTEETDAYRVDKRQFKKELSELEARLDSDLMAPSEEDLREAVTMFQDFAGIFPEDPKAPDYLLKASDFSLMLGMPEKSVKILERIMREFPKYNRMEDVAYNRASHLDFEIRDTNRAKEAYIEFISAYPNSELVDDAQSRIENIKYSLEELTEKFLQDLENGTTPAAEEEVH
jgi:outer membrane protein assembly factor BamD (BamD/ComL family)